MNIYMFVYLKFVSQYFLLFVFWLQVWGLYNKGETYHLYNSFLFIYSFFCGLYISINYNFTFILIKIEL